jgi:DNA replication protein DnaC
MSRTAATASVDAARLELLLGELRLPAITRLWPSLAEQSDREGWPAVRFLAALAELELAERDRRRIERHLVEARLPATKTLDEFDFAAVPMVSKAQMHALAAGDSWLAPMGQQAADVGAATRIYWTFKVMGHDDVSILDGGWVA